MAHAPVFGLAVGLGLPHKSVHLQVIGVDLRDFLPRGEWPTILRKVSLTVHQSVQGLVPKFDGHDGALRIARGRVTAESRRWRLLLRREVRSITPVTMIGNRS
jgi:hypothetical protein